MSVEGSTECRVVLGPTCTIRESGELRAELLRALDSRAVVVDASAVARVDTAALQLLVVFVCDRGRNDLATRWDGVARTLRDAAARLGIADSLRFPPASA